MMNEDELFFFHEAIRHARQLPLAHCLQFLRGMLSAMREDHESARILRSIIAQLTCSDAQLELIQIGQLKINLDSPRRRDRKDGR